MNSKKISGGGHLDSQPATPGVNVTHLLPENLEQIFVYLSTRDKGRVALVCHAWRNAVSSPSVWRRDTAKLRLNKRPSKSLISCLDARRIQHVQVLKVGGANHLRELIDGVDCLKSLTFAADSAATDLMLTRAFFSPRPNVTSVDLADNRLITDVTVTVIAVNVRALTSLNLENCELLTDTSFSLISMGLRNLTALNIWGCHGVSDAGVRHLFSVDNPKDERLNLKCLRMCGDKLTNNAISYVAKSQRELTKLDLRPSDHMTVCAMKLLSTLDRLGSLLLFGNERVNDSWLSCLSNCEWNLECLEVVGCDRVSIYGFDNLAYLRKLKKLAIRECVQLGHHALFSLVRSVISHLIIDNCPITDDVLSYLADMAHLRKLELLNNPSVTNAGIVNLAKGESKITGLTLSNCPKLDSSVLCLIASGLFQVRQLVLGTGYVTDKGLFVASRVLDKLESLLVGGEQLMGRIRDLRRSNTGL